MNFCNMFMHLGCICISICFCYYFVVEYLYYLYICCCSCCSNMYCICSSRGSSSSSSSISCCCCCCRCGCCCCCSTLIVSPTFQQFQPGFTGADSLTVDPLSRACRFQIRPSDLSCRMEGPGSAMPGDESKRCGRIENFQRFWWCFFIVWLGEGVWLDKRKTERWCTCIVN